MKHKCAYCGNKFVLTSTQKGHIKLKRNVYCSQKCYRNYWSKNGIEIRQSKLKKLGQRKCEFCDKLFWPNDPRQRFCTSFKDKGCGYKIRLADSKRNPDPRFKRPIERPKGNGKTCTICGQDPYPNYYFCPSCHTKVSNSVDYNEHSCSVI